MNIATTSANDMSLSSSTRPPRRVGDYIHACGHVSSWGRCVLHAKIDTLPHLWGVAEVVPATAGEGEHLHPFQYCESEQTAVDIWAHHSSRATPHVRTPVVVIHRDLPGDRWEATL